MNQLILRQAIEASWDKSTAYNPDQWSDNNPAEGQCAVTALIICDYFPYPINCTIRRGFVEVGVGKHKTIVSHYWNKIDDLHIDLTWKQFPNGSTLVKNEYVSKDELLKDKHTLSRYKILKSRVEKYLLNRLLNKYPVLVKKPKEGMKILMTKVYNYNLVSQNEESLGTLWGENIEGRIDEIYKNGTVSTDQGWEISDLIKAGLVYTKAKKS